MSAQRGAAHSIALRVLGGAVLVALIAWAFMSYFTPELMFAFADWVRSCF